MDDEDLGVYDEASWTTVLIQVPFVKFTRTIMNVKSLQIHQKDSPDYHNWTKALGKDRGSELHLKPRACLTPKKKEKKKKKEKRLPSKFTKKQQKMHFSIKK